MQLAQVRLELEETQQEKALEVTKLLEHISKMEHEMSISVKPFDFISIWRISFEDAVSRRSIFIKVECESTLSYCTKRIEF